MVLIGWDSNRLLSSLSEAAVEPILPRVVNVPLVCREVLREGVYFPISGLIAEFALVKDRHSYTGMVGKEGALHIEYLGVPPFQIQASVLAPGRAAWMSASVFRDVWARNDAVREMHLGYCQSRLTYARQSAACNATHAAEPRFCTWLLRARDCLGGDVISITQEQAAEMLGIRRTTVNIFAQDLQKAGIIHCGRGKIQLLNRAGLEALSCGCYRPGSVLSPNLCFPDSPSQLRA
jgi:CRP-like cAMP-binding protein